jgi:predicted acyltransferase
MTASSAEVPVGSLSLPDVGAERVHATRLVSLDVFRGATIAGMILVNNAGDEPAAYGPLQHARWNGWTPTDLIFPFFLFIVGVAMAFSLHSRLERGQSRGALFRHILWRGLLILALGIFLNGFPNHYQLHSLRFYGVLQRIAICYVITAMLELWTGWRPQVAAAAACLIGYWLLMRYVPVPGFGTPGIDIPILDPDRNIAAWLDRWLLMGHLYEITRDPEGILSTIPAVATCLLGLLTGKWLRRSSSDKTKTYGLFVSGAIALIAGQVLSIWFPINKKLWTSSFVVFTAGMALLSLTVCYWLVDVKKWRKIWSTAFLVLGANAIASYCFAEVVAHVLYRIRLHNGISLQQYIYSTFFEPVSSPPNSSLLYACGFLLFCWLFMLVLYRRRIFIKI